jgi:hypothetical protein
MNSEYLRTLANKLTELEVIEKSAPVLIEGKGHLDHPEDAIFIGGSSYASTAVQACVLATQNPQLVTIKWDGYPALIFGRGSNGKFAIMDKHMFNKAGGVGRTAYTPEMFRKYDLDRGVDRSDLHRILAQIWPGLSKEDKGSGYYWGDLLFSQPLQDQNGLYKFRANPNGIMYTVDTNSDIGKLLTGKSAGIAVHQYIPVNSASTDDAKSLNGSIGQLKNSSNVAIVPSAMPNPPKLKADAKMVKNCNTAIQQYGAAVDTMLVPPAGTKSVLNSNLFTVYINRKVVSGNMNNLLQDFYTFFETRPMSEQIRAKIIEHLKQNETGVEGAFKIFIEIYNLKMSIVAQLDKASKNSPVKGYLQDGTETHEGFVAYGFKFVDRMGFSRQNLAARG